MRRDGELIAKIALETTRALGDSGPAHPTLEALTALRVLTNCLCLGPGHDIVCNAEFSGDVSQLVAELTLLQEITYGGSP